MSNINIDRAVDYSKCLPFMLCREQRSVEAAGVSLDSEGNAGCDEVKISSGSSTGSDDELLTTSIAIVQTLCHDRSPTARQATPSTHQDASKYIVYISSYIVAARTCIVYCFMPDKLCTWLLNLRSIAKT